MSYLTQTWEKRSVLHGEMVYSLLLHDEFAVIYDDSFYGFDGIVTAFSDEVLDFMGVVEGDWRREFDELFESGYDESFLLFRKLYKEYGVGMMISS